jgi:hypothetical protein
MPRRAGRQDLELLLLLVLWEMTGKAEKWMKGRLLVDLLAEMMTVTENVSLKEEEMPIS